MTSSRGLGVGVIGQPGDGRNMPQCMSSRTAHVLHREACFVERDTAMATTPDHRRSRRRNRESCHRDHHSHPRCNRHNRRRRNHNRPHCNHPHCNHPHRNRLRHNHSHPGRNCRWRNYHQNSIPHQNCRPPIREPHRPLEPCQPESRGHSFPTAFQRVPWYDESCYKPANEVIARITNK